MVTIFVGAKRKKFVLHKMLVCREAPYFDKAFNGSFEEAKTQECYLPDDESFTFELFVSYIYTNRFPDDVKAVSGVIPVYEPVMKFYVLADKLLMSNAAKTASLDALIKARATSGLCLNKTTITFVLARTAEDCPLRQLAFDIISRDFLATPDLGRDWLACCLKDVSFEQTTQLLMAMKNLACIKPGLSEEFPKKMVRETRSIATAPEYQTGYLKGKQGSSSRGSHNGAARGRGTRGGLLSGGWC
jgi:BTB/POZ domain